MPREAAQRPDESDTDENGDIVGEELQDIINMEL